MTLEEEVKKICNRLSNHGWRELLLLHGLDILSEKLTLEMMKPLANIDRTFPGFLDFSLEGTRGIEARQPAHSLFYHAVASPSVITGADGSELTSFPTLAELEIIENYIYGITPPQLTDIRAEADGAPMAIVVFTSEYRPAPETVHLKHADVCFSRTGVARVGTAESLYSPKLRGFLPFVEENPHSIRVLPARYSAYIAFKLQGNEGTFGPMRPRDDDENRDFWVPVHKLFNGDECIQDLHLNVSLISRHINQKLRKIHTTLGKSYETGWQEPDISLAPFWFTKNIAEWSTHLDFGSGVLLPVVHNTLVEAAQYQGKALSLRVPKGADTLSSSLRIPDIHGARPAPEYVHVRSKVSETGSIEDLNNLPDVIELISEGEYRALHYIDYTADGWIEAVCPDLELDVLTAYSLVTAPDFFPSCDQRELMDWWEHTLPQSMKRGIWVIPPETLSDNRMAANLTLVEAGFDAYDDTITSVVSSPYKHRSERTTLDIPPTQRHSYLPDAASGVFAPGWDISYDRTSGGIEFLAAYGLGSPFPEDAKLCAALSTYWPAVAPDAARTFQPNHRWPTVCPLTDEEIGQVGNLPWDGIRGPHMIQADGKSILEYQRLDYADYVDSAIKNKYTLALTGNIDVTEYKARVLAMVYVYRALGISFDSEEETILEEKGNWSVYSFLKVQLSDEELQSAKSQTNTTIQGDVYRFEMYRHGEKSVDTKHFNKIRVEINEMVIVFVINNTVLLKRQNSDWILSDAVIHE
ncbi:hypothetical protein [Paenibacillus terrae]|uniref:Uncharacterized protein n=1 Tax=Paenibacillus terrae TaxID=159743 RepID=A0A0D7WTR6_9BACL|nr:hypothetical protein [Paenibacillus terrae]KJD42389.1 hypothetical protein QD47_28480 [Paenibacillus terrae]